MEAIFHKGNVFIKMGQNKSHGQFEKELQKE